MTNADPSRAALCLALALTARAAAGPLPETAPAAGALLAPEPASPALSVRQAGRFPTHEGRATAVALDPEGRTLAVAANGMGELRYFDTASGALLSAAPQGRAFLTAVWSPAGDVVAAGVPGEPLRLWRAPDAGAREAAKAARAARGPALIMKKAGLTSEQGLGRVGANGLLEKAAVMDAAPAAAPCGNGVAQAFSADGTTLAEAFPNVIRVFGGGAPRTLEPHAGGAHFTCVAVSADGRQVAAGLDEGQVEVWELATGGGALGHILTTGAAHALAFSTDGRELFTLYSNGQLLVHDLASGERVDLPTGRGVRLFDGALHAGRRLAAGVTPRGEIAVVQVGSGRVLWSARPHAPVSAVAFSASGGALVTGHDDGTCTVWTVPAP